MFNSKEPSLIEGDTQKSTSKSTSKSSKKGTSKQILSSEETIQVAGRTFNKAAYERMSKAMKASTILTLPKEIEESTDKDNYHYFYPSTEFPNQIEQCKDKGYEVVHVDGKEVRHFAGIDKSGSRHEHVLMRMKKEDKDLMNAIAHEKKRGRTETMTMGKLDPNRVYEKASRLRSDGELTMAESMANKYNFNKIKQS